MSAGAAPEFCVMEPPKSDTGGAEQDEPRVPFLSGAPRSGEVSTFAQRLFGECFVLLASMVVFGSTLNLVAAGTKCGGLCGYAIATGIISALVILLLMFGHYLTWSSKMDRSNWFNSNAEKNAMAFLVVWWAAGVGGLSAVVTKEPPLSQNEISAIFDVLNLTQPNSTIPNFTDLANALSSGSNISGAAGIDLLRTPVPIRHASGIGIFFGWLAFFGSIYTTFKAYHSSKEEQRALNYAQHYPYAAAAEEEEHYANF